MRCERVTRPTLRGVKRAEDSVKEDICLELSSRGSRIYRETGVKLETEAGWLGSDISTSHFLYSQDSTEISPTRRISKFLHF